MTDEEMAEINVENYGIDLCCYCRECDRGINNPCEHKKDALHGYKDGFFAGLEAGRPKWHKVADGDLPEAKNYFWSRTVLLQTNKGSSIIGFYDHATKAWYEKATDDIVYGVVEWCEIPTFDKE